MMDIEEIEDNSSQESNIPPATTTAVVTKKKRANNKKNPPAVASPSTLTRFLGPAGPPSRSAWEDVNRQCPVCQQTGFSSRSLALHVNDCLDVKKSAPEAESSDGENEAVDGTSTGVESGVRDADGRNAPKGASARGTGKTGSSSTSKAAGTAIRQGHAGIIPRELPSNTSRRDCTEEQRLRSEKTAKKTKVQQDRRARGAEKPACPAKSKVATSQSRGQVNENSRPGAKPLQPRLPNLPQRPIPLRRRGLGLARPRGQQTGSDSTPTPGASTAPAAAAAAPESRDRKGSAEHALDDIARAQLLYTLEASAAGETSKGGGWLGTHLFPKPGAIDSGVDERRADCLCNSNGGQDTWGLSCGAVACGASRDDGKVTVTKSSRVRARPASWGTRICGKRRGWLGIWSGGTDGEDGNNYDDCWGDGDGHLTLRPFPSLAESGAEDVSDDGAAALVGDTELLPPNEQSNPAPASRADRFLQVFSQLQPARKALNLYESPPSSPKASEDNRAQVERTSERWIPRVDDVHARVDSAKLDPKNQAETADAGIPPATRPIVVDLEERGTAPGARNRATASGYEGGIVGKLTMPVPKRAALESLRPAEASAGDRLPQSVKAASGRPSWGDTECQNRHAASSTEVPCSLEPASGRKVSRKESSVASQQNRRQTAPQRQEGPRWHGEGGHTDTGGSGETPRSPAPALRRASEAKYSSGADRVTNDTTASSRDSPRIIKTSGRDTPVPTSGAAGTGSSSARLGRATTPPVPLTSQSPGAMPVENGATGKRRKPLAPVDRAHLTSPECETLEPTLRQASLGSSGGMINRLACASSTTNQPTVARQNRQGTPTANDRSKELRADPQLDKKHAAAFSSQWSGSRSRGALACRASSGLLRSVDLAAEPGNQQTGSEVEKLAPAASNGLVELSASDVSQQELCEGHEMDMSQNGSLTVVWDHGATLRSSWSIDDSQELGRLMFGACVEYDAVWYLSPADADCVGVVRYRVVPHPSLAPTGGWISERGRLRDDPYTILEATPAPTPPNRKAIPLPAVSSNQPLAGGEATPGQGGASPRGYQQQVNTANDGLAKPAQARKSTGRMPPSSWGGNVEKSQATPGMRKGQAERCDPRGLHGDHSSAGTVAGGSRRMQPQPQSQPASKVVPRPESARGSFGLATSPSAKALEANDSGDKVTCPVCHRGMDHWKSGQRQQHVHYCLLKQPSSAKKPPPPADVTPTATRVLGSANRPGGRGLSGGVSGSSHSTSTPCGSRGPEQPGTGASGRADTRPSRGELLPDSTESPRSTRVSLQGVFSSKPTHGPHGASHEPRQPVRRCGGSSSRVPPPASTTAPRQRGRTPVRTSGTGISLATKTSKVSASRGAAHVGVPVNKVPVASKGLSECPVCRLKFGGRQGQWERQAHIQQCLDSLEGMFDSEE